jgi:hypothetical protein
MAAKVGGVGLSLERLSQGPSVMAAISWQAFQSLTERTGVGNLFRIARGDPGPMRSYPVNRRRHKTPLSA